MKLFLKKTLLTGLILLTTTNLWASPQLERTRDVGTSIENSKGWVYEFTFPDNQSLKLKNDGSAYTFLMIDGNIISNLNLPIVKGRSFIPLRFLSETLGMTVKWDNSSKTAHITKGSNQISVPASKNTNDVQLINGSTYVSIRFLGENFPLSVCYYPFSLDDKANPFNILLHPIVTVDSNDVKEKLTKDQAIELAKSELSKAYNSFSANTTYNTGTKESNQILTTLKNDIDSITYVNKVSRYYILDGPYPILVDAVTGSLYFRKDKINKSSIELIDVSNPDIFADNYFVG